MAQQYLVQQAVNDALDNCRENGYEDVLRQPAEAIAEDLKDLDTEVDQFDLEDIAPAVMVWKAINC